jgi:F-type H+-transporting ATPase subunit alpha
MLGSNGYLDEVPVEKATEFAARTYGNISKNSKPQYVEIIKEVRRNWTDEVVKLASGEAITEYQQAFAA